MIPDAGSTYRQRLDLRLDRLEEQRPACAVAAAAASLDAGGICVERQLMRLAALGSEAIPVHKGSDDPRHGVDGAW